MSAKSTKEEIPVEELSYEQAYQELEAIVNALEAGDQPLEQALTMFERGQVLASYCANLLDQAELKVSQISGEELVNLD